MRSTTPSAVTAASGRPARTDEKKRHGPGSSHPRPAARPPTDAGSDVTEVGATGTKKGRTRRRCVLRSPCWCPLVTLGGGRRCRERVARALAARADATAPSRGSMRVDARRDDGPVGSRRPPRPECDDRATARAPRSAHERSTDGPRRETREGRDGRTGTHWRGTRGSDRESTRRTGREEGHGRDVTGGMGAEGTGREEPDARDDMHATGVRRGGRRVIDVGASPDRPTWA